MAKVKWTFRAQHQLDQIYEYHAQTSERYAEKLIDTILERVLLLEKVPLMGRKVPEMADEFIREIIVKGYRIAYVYLPGEDVQIIIVRHSSLPINHPDNDN
ncbi:MAG: type II toxin-antitoxin system RelE/ParE family toxin [Saprospiraceae bacterium]